VVVVVLVVVELLVVVVPRVARTLTQRRPDRN
jgi:type II secretory pathway component PulF